MRKIGILTFHWATNYGAVLQAYALQKWLCDHRYHAEIMNYRPFLVLFKQNASDFLHRKTEIFKKERRINSFRRKYLKISSRTYRSNLELKNKKCDYDTVICGSDQVWNRSFTLNAEMKPTLSYFLNFADSEVRRISYAASFGSITVPDCFVEVTRPELCKFHRISVRENSGVDILNGMGISGVVVPDPTVLLSANDYKTLTSGCVRKNGIFPYFLHGVRLPAELKENIAKEVNSKFVTITQETYGVEEWLNYIQCSDLVVTNSFHGVMLSLILNKPFIAFLLDKSGMNDRIITVLDAVGLNDRAVYMNDTEGILSLCRKSISWKIVNEKLNDLRKIGEDYLTESLS